MYSLCLAWLVIALLSCAVAATKASWQPQTIAPADLSNDKYSLPDQHANVSLSAEQICRLDRLHITFTVSRLINAHDLAIGFIRCGRQIGSVVAVEQIPTDFEGSTDDRNGLITCDINESHCTPKVREIKAQSDRNLLKLQFEVTTNEVPLPNATAVTNALDIVPRLSYDNASGQWTAPDALALQLSPQDMQRILSAHSRGEKIEVTARQQRRRDHRGRVSIRPSEAGEYEVVMVDRTDMRRLPERVSAPQYVRVELCDDAVVMPGFVDKLPHLQATSQSAGSSAGVSGAGGVTISATAGANKLLTIPGPAALTGTEPLAFSHNTVDPSKSGTFSVSTWIRLVEPATGRFRAVLHKGSPDGQTRTPSIWLMPNDNRLSIRVSTVTNADTGAETIGALPTNHWAHLAVVFENHTHTHRAQASAQEPSRAGTTGTAAQAKHSEAGFRVSHPPDYYAEGESEYAVTTHNDATSTTSSAAVRSQYTVSVYLNGVLDVKMDFNDPVVGNEFSASFFKDVSFKGPKGFLDDFTLWSGVLTVEQVQAEFLSTAGRNRYMTADAALDVLEAAENGLVFRTAPSERAIAGSDALVPILLQRAKDSLAACEAFEARLDLYADAAERGSAEALYRWALLVKQGSEVGNSACGVATAEEAAGGGGTHKTNIMASIWGKSSDSGVQGGNSGVAENDRATLAFLVAADMGHAPALSAVAFALLNGAGARALWLHNSTELLEWRLPVPASYRATLGATAIATALRARLLAGLDNRCPVPVWIGPVATPVGVEVDIGRSVLQATTTSADPSGTISNVEALTGRKGLSVCADPSQMAQGLLEVAAMHGDAEAHQALYYRFKEGLGVLTNEETAAFYQRLPARVTGEEFDRVGAQAIVEMDRIDDKTAPQVSRGNEGNDDELIQHQKIRAQEGHLPSILAMADLYYYGARGLPRDHARALRYYEQAAALGDQSGLCGAAGMYLKGEGTPTNVTRAVSLYEEASELGSIRALNGLGYMYFYGQSVPQNQTKAFEYFLAAASYETDGDSLFNAAHCLENGLGVEKDLSRAVQLYTVGAKKLGSFNCIRSLAGMYLEGRGVARSAKMALSYFSAATAIGPWAGWVRRGLDQYLRGHYDRSLGAYLHAAELGFEVGQSNAAYILRAKLKPPSPGAPSSAAISCTAGDTCPAVPLADVWGNSTVLHDRLLARLYRLSAHHGSRDSYLQLGTCYFKGHCGVGAVNHERALWHYSKASYLGSPLGSAYLGVMHHFGLGTAPNPLRAARYYTLALEQDTDKSVSGLVQSLQYALSAKDYYFMMPVNLGLDYVVRTLW